MLVTDYLKFFIVLVGISVIPVGLKTVWDWLFLLFIAGYALYYVLKEEEVL